MKNIHDLIPGGAHTYSKGDDQFPENAPKFIKRGEGCILWGSNNKKYIDLTMSLGTVLLGHSYQPVLEAVKKELNKGVNFCRPSLIEGKLAEILNFHIPSAEMVKFGKHGSDAVSGAIKLARAYTGRSYIVRCQQDPFNSVHDWFIGSTIVDRGIPNEVKKLTLKFEYNNIENCKEIFEQYPNQIACFVLEPYSFISPNDYCKKFNHSNNNKVTCSCDQNSCKSDFLEDLKKLCEKNGSLLIFDEVVSGFRYDIGGVQKLINVKPHLSAFGKAMANGFSVSALVGQKEFMKLGGIKHENEKVFLMSSTHGGETHSIAAAIKTIQSIDELNLINHFWSVGEYFQKQLKKIIIETKSENIIEIKGFYVKPVIQFKDFENYSASLIRTFFLQETINQGILMPYVVPSFAHDKATFDKVVEGSRISLLKIMNSIKNNRVKNDLNSPIIKPVFRKYN